MKLFFFLLIALVTVASATPRPISCNGTRKDIPSWLPPLYAYGADIHDSPLSFAKDTLNFEAIAYLASAGVGLGDIGEFMVTVKNIEAQLNDVVNVTLKQVKETWADVFGDKLLESTSQAEDYVQRGLTEAAREAYYRSFGFAQLSIRFTDWKDKDAMNAYEESIEYFSKAMSMGPAPGSGGGSCKRVYPPYENTTLHGYLCTPAGKPRGTILAHSGYDGTAEITYVEVGAQSLRHGFQVLIFDGPGQGWVARKQRLLFRPDWEAVVGPMIDFVCPKGCDGPIVVWGRSFGGYLSPRAFAMEPRLDAAVADGGVYDFYQSMLCAIPESARDVFFTDPAKFDSMGELYRKYALSIDFMLNFGELGFGTTKWSELMLAFEPYNLMDPTVLSKTSQRPMVLNDPMADTMTGTQSDILMDHLPNKHAKTKLVSTGWQDGTALHCGVGSTMNAASALLRWIEEL